MSSTTPAPAGKSLFESRTVWSILMALLFYVLPSILSAAGVKDANDQASVAVALHQIVAPIAMICAIIFHAISTKPVTSILPAKAPPAAVAILAVFLIGAVAAPSLFLSACATTPKARLVQGKADAVAWATLQSVANTLDGLATARVIHGQQALTVADWLNRAEQFLTAADAAYQAGDQATAATNVALAAGLVTALIEIATHPDHPLPVAPVGASAPVPAIVPGSYRAPAVPLALHHLRVAVVVAHSREG